MRKSVGQRIPEKEIAKFQFMELENRKLYVLSITGSKTE
jgi:hypothetical protein